MQNLSSIFDKKENNETVPVPVPVNSMEQNSIPKSTKKKNFIPESSVLPDIIDAESDEQESENEVRRVEENEDHVSEKKNNEEQGSESDKIEEPLKTAKRPTNCAESVNCNNCQEYQSGRPITFNIILFYIYYFFNTNDY